MATKKGAGNEPQNYDPKTGKYGNGGDLAKTYSTASEGDIVGGRELEAFPQSKPNNFTSTNKKGFHSALSTAKASVDERRRWRVDVHDEADYANDKLFVTAGGSCVAVTPEKDIISVCKNSADTIRGSELLKKAVAEGGDRLDAFGKDLYGFYTHCGFEPVSWTPFNEQYAPVGWDNTLDKPEPVIFYKYTGKQTKLSYEEFMNTVNSSPEYDGAKSIRDKEFAK